MARKSKALTVREIALSQALLPRESTIIYDQLIKWKDGVPTVLATTSRIADDPQNALTNLLSKVLDLPYDGPDSALQGLSLGEAMIVNQARQAADGNSGARQEIFERLVGSVEQKIKSVNLSGTLSEFLDEVARKEKIIDVTIQPDQTVDISDL